MWGVDERNINMSQVARTLQNGVVIKTRGQREKVLFAFKSQKDILMYVYAILKINR